MTIKHEDSTKIDLIESVCKAEAANEALPYEERKPVVGVLGTLIPTPQKLLDTVSGSSTPQAVYDANLAEFGYKDWYDFQVAKWGTKWDLCDVDAQRISPNEIYLTFTTAWTPPTAACETLTEQGFSIVNEYCEPGMGFAGVWNEGADQECEVWEEFLDTEEE
jgi:hypothetical protein